MGPGSITIDDGVYQDALAAAAEHGVSVSAWITRCTRLPRPPRFGDAWTIKGGVMEGGNPAPSL
jgi:hypothetical protein